MKSILILNATIINENSQKISDIFVKDGRINQISNDLSHINADINIDATGKYIVPGMIDDQVHFREPGLTDKADIRSESLAAVIGGTTSFMDMPNNKPPIITKVKTKKIKGTVLGIAKKGIYEKIPQNIEIMRYHSLVVDIETLPDCFVINGISQENDNKNNILEIKQITPKCEIMAISHKIYPIYGCLLYTSPSPRDLSTSRMPSSA
mgnify:CR=1 FL=1